MSGTKNESLTYSSSLPSIPLLDSNNQELPGSLKQLHIELTNFGYGFFNELSIQKKKTNPSIELINQKDM